MYFDPMEGNINPYKNPIWKVLIRTLRRGLSAKTNHTAMCHSFDVIIKPRIG